MQKVTAHFETAGIQSPGLEHHHQGIASVDGAEEIAAAMHHRQGHVGEALLAATAGKHITRIQAEGLEALLPAFMTPTQQLVKVHHTSSIGVAEANRPFQGQPGRDVQRTQRSTDPMITSMEPRMAMMSATLCPLRM